MRRGLVFLAFLAGWAGAAIGQETRVITLSDGLVFTGRATTPVTIAPENGLVFFGRRQALDINGYWKVSYDGVRFDEIIGVVQENNDVAMDLVVCEVSLGITDCLAKRVLNNGNLFKGKWEGAFLQGRWTPFCGPIEVAAESSLAGFPVQLKPAPNNNESADLVRISGTSETLPGEETCSGTSPFEEIVLERIGDLPNSMTLVNRFAYGCVAGDFGQDRSIEVTADDCKPFDFEDSGMPDNELGEVDLFGDSLGETDILGQ